MKSKHPRKVYVAYEATCNNCNGEGGTSDNICYLCAGTGHVFIEKEIYISVTHSETKPVKFIGKQIINT